MQSPSSSAADPPGIAGGKRLTFPSFVNYLRKSSNHVKDEGLDLVGLLVLFSGRDWTTNFLSSLPVKLSSTTAHNLLTSAQLIAKNLKVVPPLQTNLGLRDIKSISFEVGAANGATLEWSFPLETYPLERPASPYRVVLNHMDITIERPACFERTLRGVYDGTFQGHPIHGEFTPTFSLEAMVYKSTFLKPFSMVDLLVIFFGTEDFHYSERLKTIKVPGLEVLEGFAAERPSLDTSFVIKTTRSNSFLTQVSGGYPFERMNLGPKWGILMNTSLSVDRLRIVLSCISSPVDYQIVFELGGELDQSIPFRLSAGSWELKTFFELAILPGSTGGASIRRLLELTGSSDILRVTSGFPAVSNLSNDLAISSAAVGWVGHNVNFLGLGLDVGDWKIVDQKFEIENLSLDIYSTNPFHLHQFSLLGSGMIKISHVELQVFFNVQLPAIDFRIATLGRPLTLKSLFGHFFKEDSLSFPSGFNSILEQTGIDSTIVEGSHGSNGWSLSRFAMTMSIDDQLDIFENFRLSLPSLAVNITHPFDKTGRKFQACIDAAITADVNCSVSISLAVGNATSGQSVDDSIQLTFCADGALSLGALIRMFRIHNTRVSIPTNMSPLLEIGLASASAKLSRRYGKYSLDNISVSVVSSKSLRLWDDVVLKNLGLSFKYSESSHKVKFYGDLSSGGTSDLKVVLAYNDPSPPSSQLPSSSLASIPDDTIAITAAGKASWSGEIQYDHTISILEITSRMTSIDIKKVLSSAGLTLFRNFNFDLQAVDITLAYGPTDTSLTFSANINFPVVHSLCLKFQKAHSWLYSLKFSLSSADFFSQLGIHHLSLEDATIIISNGIGEASFPDTTVGHLGLSVALSATLIWGEPLKLLKKIAPSDGRLIISGVIGNDFLKLYVKTGELALFDDMTLSGYMGVVYINSDLRFVMLGDLENINIPELSSETFETTFSLFVEVPNPEIDFTFQLSKLVNAFKFKGLDFENIVFGVGFSEEFPIPSELSAAGQVQFCVDRQSFAGSVALYFDQNSLSRCGVGGSFHTCPSFSQALTGFANACQTAPRKVDGTFANLRFRFAPKGFLVGTTVVPQGYSLAGSLNLPSCGFDASFDIEISPKRIHVDGDIENAIVFSVNGTKLFALSQASAPSRGPSIDMTITGDSFMCDLSAEVYLLGLSAGISATISDNGLEIHEFISASVGSVRLDLTANNQLFYFSMSCTFALSFPSFFIGTIEVPSIRTVGFSALLATRVVWSKAIWQLTVTGDLSLMWWYMGTHTFTLDANFSDLEHIAQQIANEIGELYNSAFVTKIRQMLEDSVKEVVVFLSNIGMAALLVGKLLVQYFGCEIGEVVEELGDVFDMGLDALVPIMKDLGMAYLDVLHTVLQWGNDIESVAGSIANTFGLSVGQVIQDAVADPVHAVVNFVQHIQLPPIQLPPIQLPTIQLPSIHL